MNQGKKQLLIALDSLEPFSKNRSVKPTINYYKTTSGKKLGIDKKLIVSFSDLSIQLYIEKEFSLSLKSTLNPQMFVYQIESQDKTLEVANLLSKIEGISFAHPDFIVQKKSRTNDPLFAGTWHLDSRNGIHVEEAWKYTKGEGVIVGVYDEGIDIEHEDLRDNIIGYGNYNTDARIDMVAEGNALDNSLSNAPAPAPNSDLWHGTSCAGLIAAGENELGSVGVAPKAKLLALRYSNNNISNDIKAFDAMADHGAAIISNSWGTYTMFDSFNLTLKRLSENGRDGKGVLIFFAAGNDGCNMDQYYSVDANGDYSCESSSRYTPIHDESESPYVISIAASTEDNVMERYSNYGSSIDFTAPGQSIVTTDKSGQEGAADMWNYTWNFAGTSAAAPIAAGVAALILSENPTLSKEEVVEILKDTADRYGRYRYVDGRNDHWGYGLVNAGAAVTLASSYGKIKIENFAHKIYKNMH